MTFPHIGRGSRSWLAGSSRRPIKAAYSNGRVSPPDCQLATIGTDFLPATSHSQFRCVHSRPANCGTQSLASVLSTERRCRCGSFPRHLTRKVTFPRIGRGSRSWLEGPIKAAYSNARVSPPDCQPATIGTDFLPATSHSQFRYRYAITHKTCDGCGQPGTPRK
jgi:hypothetical protein